MKKCAMCGWEAMLGEREDLCEPCMIQVENLLLDREERGMPSIAEDVLRRRPCISERVQ